MEASYKSSFPNYGMENPNPVDKIIQEPLDHNTLNDMNLKDRNKSVVGRANFFAQINLEPYALDGSVRLLLVGPEGALNAAIAAKTARWNPLPQALKMPVDQLSSQHKMLDKLKANRDATISHMRKEYTQNEVSTAFNNSIINFKTTKLFKRLETLVSKLCKSGKFNKIVAFGAGTLDFQGGRDLPQGVKQLTQHAALLSIQDIWEEANTNKKGNFQIYLQDPLYSMEDVKVAKEHGMTIVKGIFSHQMGWVNIDDSTLVVDFSSPFELQLPRLVFEMSRPAGVLICHLAPKCIKREEEHFQFVGSNNCEEITLLTKMPTEKEQVSAYPSTPRMNIGDVLLPHYGIQKRIFSKYWEEYDARELDTIGLKMGTKADRLTNADEDGCGGECYLGGKPILLERKA